MSGDPTWLAPEPKEQELNILYNAVLVLLHKKGFLVAVLSTRGMTIWIGRTFSGSSKKTGGNGNLWWLVRKGETQAQNDMMIHMGAPGKVRPLAVLCSYQVIMQYGTAGHGRLPDDNI